MKLRNFIPAIIVFVIGILVTVIGALFRILHWELGPFNGGVLLAIGSALDILSGVILIAIILRHHWSKNK
ncbi:MAG: hypothetical protein AAF466_08240 [Bacteroidota bacterium]